MNRVPPLALERWFASLARAPRINLAGSGAPPRTLAELSGLASPEERRELETISLGYGPPDGSEELRRAIAARQGADACDVLVTCGAIEALNLAVSAIVRPGDEVIVQDPMYPAVAGLAALRGASVVRWRLDPERGFRAALDELAGLLDARTRLVAITQPNGPTGSVIESRELEDLVAMLAAQDLWLLSDEVYRDLVLEPGLAITSAQRYDRTVTVGDVAKPFGLGGLRIGWLVARDRRLCERVACLRDYTTLSIPTPSDTIARVALSHADALLAPTIAHARANLTRLAALVARDHSLSLVPPRAGLTAFPRVRNAARVQRALQDDGVLVVPGTLFGCPDRLRIGLGVPPDDFALGIERLAHIL